MKKKYLAILAAAGFLLASGFAVSATASPKEDGWVQKWGKVLSEHYSSQQKQPAKATAQEDTNTSMPEDSKIFEKGKNAVITTDEIEQAAAYYQLGEMSEKEAYEKAADYARKREALYQEALKNGYQVTDQEVWDYLEQFKEELHEYQNSSMVDTIMNQFDSEEDYWNYEFTVYLKNLPIQNYVHDLEQEYLTQHETPTINWETHFEELKETLAANENYQEVQ